MRNYLTSVAFAAICLLPYGEAWPQAKSLSTGELFGYCRGNNQTARTMCALYMTGFMNGLTIEQINPKKVCMPEGMTGNRVKEVFEGFMRDYPKLQTDAHLDQPGIIVHLALFRAYPCPGTAPNGR